MILETARSAPDTTPVRLAAAGETWLVRRPFVFRRADFIRGLATASDSEGLSVNLDRAGVARSVAVKLVEIRMKTVYYDHAIIGK